MGQFSSKDQSVINSWGSLKILLTLDIANQIWPIDWEVKWDDKFLADQPFIQCWICSSSLTCAVYICHHSEIVSQYLWWSVSWEKFCNVSLELQFMTILGALSAIWMTAGGFAPPPIHFIDSKWICDSSSNGFVIMALGFLPTINCLGMGAESVMRWWQDNRLMTRQSFDAIFQPLL